MSKDASRFQTRTLMASSLVLASMLFSYFQKLRLERENLVSVVRAIIQLFAAA